MDSDGGGGSIGVSLEVEDCERRKIQCEKVYSKINVPFQFDGLKKLSHGGKGFPFPMLNATKFY